MVDDEVWPALHAHAMDILKTQPVRNDHLISDRLRNTSWQLSEQVKAFHTLP